MVEKIYNLKITEKELTNPAIRKHLLALVEMRVRLQKHQKNILISEVEHSFLKNHYSWRDVKDYAKRKDRFPNEVGKYNGKRVCIIKE